MKNLIYLLFIGVVGLTTSNAAPSFAPGSYYNGDRYIFIEGGIEFSVYPDGEFDFVVPQVINGLHINVNSGRSNISFNTGFNYDAYVQYDSYGAVIQIADVPVYYDNWGRIAQAGNIIINYNNNLLASVGGMNIYYNGNAFSYTRGYVNVYNQRIGHYPYINYMYRPYADRCLVYNTPYRRFYTPQRFSYAYHKNHYRSGYRDGYSNAYRDFNRPQGAIAHNNARVGSYREARESTSHSRNSRSNSDYSRASRSSSEARRATPSYSSTTINNANRKAAAPQRSRVSTEYQQHTTKSSRRGLKTTVNRASRTTPPRATRGTKSQNTATPASSSSGQAPSRASRSSRSSKSTSTRSSSSGSSRSSRSGGSRSGGL